MLTPFFAKSPITQDDQLKSSFQTDFPKKTHFFKGQNSKRYTHVIAPQNTNNPANSAKLPMYRSDLKAQLSHASVITDRQLNRLLNYLP
jgi:hypothetical protein